jgi:periplasmic divalent cation tolerance protein
MSNSLLIICTCPNENTAQDIANHLVKMNLAACVTIQPQATSIYRWQDKIEQANEFVLLIKTTVVRYEKLEAAIIARHPYDVPEIIAVPIQYGSTAYLTWVEQCTDISSS